MTRVNFFSLLLIISAIVFLPANLFSRVSIGSTDSPQDFSVLELFSNETMGFRLPQLSEYQRDNHLTPMLRLSETDPLTGVSAAMGLQIFNTCNQCVETWNGDDWISLCEGDTPDPCAGLANLPELVVFCSTPQPTIDSLTARARRAGGRGPIEWFSAATGGNPLPLSTSLGAVGTTTTFYAGNCAGATARTSVTVSVVNCDDPPTDGFITTFANVMYDFQQQQLFAMNTGTGAPTGWQWEVSTDNVNWTNLNLPDANTDRVMLPPNFINAFWTDVSTQRSLVLFFRCILSNPAGEVTSAAFQIHFINTTSSGYGERGGVRFLQINRVGGTFELALTNLGTNETGNVLGDLFQWGRRPDGHQTIVWEKNDDGNNDFAAVTDNNVVANNINLSGALTDPHGQVTHPDYVGRFLLGAGSWTTNVIGTHTTPFPVGSDDLWGNGLYVRSVNPWTVKAQANDPCPSGWTVPSGFDWFDMHNGDGANTPANGVHGNAESGNHWRWHQGVNGAVGGAIITNSAGEEVFLPAVGRRVNSNGALSDAGTNGTYWSSTFTRTVTDAMNSAWALWFTSGGVFTNLVLNSRANGMSVRCIAE